MSRIHFSAVAGCTLSLLPLLGSVGCSSHHDNSPYAMTGTTTYNDTAAQRAAWTDDKNKYRPDWRNGVNKPSNIPHEGAVTP